MLDVLFVFILNVLLILLLILIIGHVFLMLDERMDGASLRNTYLVGLGICHLIMMNLLDRRIRLRHPLF